MATFNGLQISPLGTYTITASDTTTGTVTAATTNSFTVTAGPPSKLVFTTTVSGNHTVGNTATVGPFVVQVQDSSGNPVANTGGPVTLTLSSNSTGTTFFTPTNGGAAAGAVTIATGASTSTFYYSDTKAGTPTITLAGATVNAQAVTGATTNGFTMVAGNANKFAFTTTVSGNKTVSTTATVGPFAVQVQDSFGNPVTNTGAAVTLSLSTTSTGTTFFTPTNGGAAAGAVTIATGASSSSNFYYSDTKAGAPTINLAGATVNAQAVTGTSTNGFTMVAGNANKLVFTTDRVGQPGGEFDRHRRPVRGPGPRQLRQPGHQCRRRGDPQPVDDLDRHDRSRTVLHHDQRWGCGRRGDHPQRRLVVDLLLLRHQAGDPDHQPGRRHGQRPGRHRDLDQRLHHGGGERQQADLHHDRVG